MLRVLLAGFALPLLATSVMAQSTIGSSPFGTHPAPPSAYQQPGDPTGALPSGGTLNGAVEVVEGGSVRVDIVAPDGSVVRRLDLGAQDSGFANFSWDGRNEAGVAQPAGNYRIRASVDNVGANTLVSARVESVTLGQNEPRLVLAGVGAVALSQVRQFS